jgi:RNA polymerase sigma-70 factor (ECF subfamily)
MTPEPQVNELVEHLFRHQAGRMLAVLTRVLGFDNLDLAEEAVQDALVQALRQWPFHGVPDHPRVWLIQVARNKALDRLRRQTSFRRKEHILEQLLEQRQATQALPDRPGADDLDDDQLAMIFACCDPALPSDAQVALTLKAVSGFSVSEIARAFLAEEPAIAQRLVRAKKRIRDTGITLAVPHPRELPNRLDSVLRVLYLVFSEGYGAHGGENLVREDLCGEAMRLAGLLAAHPATGLPKTHALLALFCFHAARLSTRLDGDGNLLLLADQPRAEWDQSLVNHGLTALDRAADGDELTEYHLQAGIAAVHATSPGFDETDWPYLLGLYDSLLALAPSPVVALNRAIVLSMVEGPAVALESLSTLDSNPAMANYYLLPAVRADFFRRLGETSSAIDCYRQALAGTCTEPERLFLEKRLESLRTNPPRSPRPSRASRGPAREPD